MNRSEHISEIEQVRANPNHQIYRTWVEIDRAALHHNLEVAKRFAPGASIMAVLKADAYGHGIEEVVAAIKNKVDYFAVASLEEALSIQEGGGHHPILLLSPALPNEYSQIAEHGFIPTISSFSEALDFSKVVPPGAAIHFKVNTGMGRLGVLSDLAEETLERITSLPLVIESISTHLPSADTDRCYTRKQLALFKKTLKTLRPLAPRAKIHCLNSAGLLHFPEEAYDTIRLGILLYGVSPLAQLQKILRPAMTWKATVCLVHNLPKGSTVSYGRTYCAPRNIRVAILPVGYGDGYPRQVSGKGASVLIQGKLAPIIGCITMDQMMIDVTHLANIKVGDQAVLMGTQGTKQITAQEIATKADTISWHLLTGITQRVRRSYYG